MAQTFGEEFILTQLDPLIQEPARFRILISLASVDSPVEFGVLRRRTGLTNGNLHGHLSRLQEAGLVKVNRALVDEKYSVTVSMTSEGWKRLESHRRDLDSLWRLLPVAS